jgi:ribonuclease VapC
VIVDSSALVAVLMREDGFESFAQALSTIKPARMSAAAYLETGIVIDARRSPLLSRRIDDLIMRASIIIEPVTESQAHIAREAYRDYGKRSGHPAGLNFGDCFAYALAREKREPLLFKGTDFDKTDIRSALAAR